MLAAKADKPKSPKHDPGFCAELVSGKIHSIFMTFP
jgi:hypothetical protein